MEEKKTDASQNPFVDNPHAPEVFAAGVAGYYILGPNIHITFWSPKANHDPISPSVSNVVIGRLVIPVLGAQSLVSGLSDFIKKQEQSTTFVPDKSKMQ